MNFIFDNFEKFWLLTLIVIVSMSLGTLALLAWAVVKLVNHFTATPAVTAFLSHTVSYLS